MELVSTKVVHKEDWIFKVSESEHTIMIAAYNPIFHYSIIRFFQSDATAKNWIDYLVMSSNIILEEKPKKSIT